VIGITSYVSFYYKNCIDLWIISVPLYRKLEFTLSLIPKGMDDSQMVIFVPSFYLTLPISCYIFYLYKLHTDFPSTDIRLLSVVDQSLGAASHFKRNYFVISNPMSHFLMNIQIRHDRMVTVEHNVEYLSQKRV